MQKKFLIEIVDYEIENWELLKSYIENQLLLNTAFTTLKSFEHKSNDRFFILLDAESELEIFVGIRCINVMLNKMGIIINVYEK